MARDLVRVNLNFGKELLEQIDEWADDVGISRSAAVAVLCSQMLASYKMTNGLEYAMKADMNEKLKSTVEPNFVTEKKPKVSYTQSIL